MDRRGFCRSMTGMAALAAMRSAANAQEGTTRSEALGVGKQPLRLAHRLRGVALDERVWLEGQTEEIAPLPVDERDPPTLIRFSSRTRRNPDNPPQAQDGQCTTFKDGSYPDFKGYGKLEVGVAPGDSGGPGFIGNKIAGVHSFGFTHFCEGVTNGTDFNCGLDSSYGEMAGDTRVSFWAPWILGVVAGVEPITSVPEPLPSGSATANRQSLQKSERARFFVDNVFARTLRLPASPPE